MSFARLTELVRATSFRIAIAYTALFLLSFAAVGFAVHAIAVNAVRNEAVTTVATEVLRLARVHERFGIAGLVAAVSNPRRPSSAKRCAISWPIRRAGSRPGTSRTGFRAGRAASWWRRRKGRPRWSAWG